MERTWGKAVSAEDIERSIIKKYRKRLWGRFIRGVKDYELIAPGDSVAVCVSGGKDSFFAAKCLQELSRHGDFAFGLRFLVMDPGYSPSDRARIIKNAEKLGVPVEIFDSDIYKIADSVSKGGPCYLCARMRRGFLYAKAREMGCNKIALGHHFDDVIETTLMSVLYGGEFKTMPPKLRSANFPGMELIRPLYCVREHDIIAWSQYHSLEFIKCGCPISTFGANGCGLKGGGKRAATKRLIAALAGEDPCIEGNIFAAAANVNLNAVLGWKDGDVKVSFLDRFGSGASEAARSAKE
ncbi:MAG: tRNA 2-thiocytidine biosynthesis protein TtcA [Clostridiales bacterium]|jgi:tRNA(Ile)-lysidine synthase TilS/MesJ|nr:tRNA 2-thiocytidine biosynthesis protein TtcA [Clostridiales bacterium]